MACRPIGKKMALVQCAASAASTAGVFFGQGPSSKVSTTSPSRRKSWLLKCSNPKPGPPVVSISTTRETPKALGLLHEVGMAAGISDLSGALSATVTTDPGAPGHRWVLPGAARVPVPEGRLFVREWRQRPPHTGQSPARTLLLPDACPTSNPKTQELLGWHGPSTLTANSRRGQQACRSQKLESEF